MAFLVTEQFKCHSELQNMGEKETERKKKGLPLPENGRP